jgi:GH25 family lysozyme M1 (1,4-beta-N-acetylmuramidase)
MKRSVRKKFVIQMSIVAAALAIGFAARQARANNLFGIDVSSFQGTVDWSAAHGGGVQWAFAKATEGNYYVDAYLDRNMRTGKLRGIAMGAYHFARPDQNCVSTEANYFWSHAGQYILADGKTIFPMVDFEVFNGHACQPSYTAWFNTWSDDVQAKTSKFMHPILYASACAGMCDVTTACTLEAWIANYNGQNLYTGNPWNVCRSCNYKDPGGTYWVWWQVSSTGAVPGISGNCDLDAYFSTLAHMQANDMVR